MKNLPRLEGPNSLFNKKLFDVTLDYLKIWYYTNVTDDDLQKNVKGIFRTQLNVFWYSEPSQTSFFNYFAENSVLDVWLDSQCTTA